MNGNELLAALLAGKIDPDDVSEDEVTDAIRQAPISLQTECGLFAGLHAYPEAWKMLSKMYPSPTAYCQ